MEEEIDENNHRFYVILSPEFHAETKAKLGAEIEKLNDNFEIDRDIISFKPFKNVGYAPERYASNEIQFLTQRLYILSFHDLLNIYLRTRQ